MNLVESIAQATFNGDYTIKQFIIYSIPDFSMAEFSEIYFTRAGQGYSKNGGGLSYYGAGKSNQSRFNHTDAQYNVWHSLFLKSTSLTSTGLLGTCPQYHQSKL